MGFPTMAPAGAALLVFLGLFMAPLRAQQYTAEPDIDFNHWAGANERINVAVQDGATMLFGGQFTSYGDLPRAGIARVLSDGSADPSFDPGTGIGGIQNAQVYAVAVQPDGRILIGGHFTTVSGEPRSRIARLLSDGSIDPTFDPGAGANALVRSIVPLPDGRIIIVGAFSLFDGVACGYIARLNADGTLDTSFNAGVGTNGPINTGLLTPAGVVLGGNFTEYNGVPCNYVSRIAQDGSLDPSFLPSAGANDVVNALLALPDGRLLLGGRFSTYDGAARSCITRIHSNGLLDASFDPGTGFLGGTTPEVKALATRADDKIFVGGSFGQYNDSLATGMARLQPDGLYDDAFHVRILGNVSTLLAWPDGSVVIGGEFLQVYYTFGDGTTRHNTARLMADGGLDLTFNNGVGSNGGSIQVIATGSDGKHLIGGDFTRYNGLARIGFARIHPNGSLDTTYRIGAGISGTAVIYPSNPTILAAAVQPDGKVVLGGIFTHYDGIPRQYIFRTLTDGSIDTAFDPGANTLATWVGKVHTIALQSDGRILFGGTNAPYLVRVNADGSPDPTFNTSGHANNLVKSTALQSDGKILVGGGFATYAGEPRAGIARLMPDGTLDPTFLPTTGIAGGTFPKVLSIKVQDDGGILIGGDFYSYDGVARFGLARLLSDGRLDTTFVPGTGVGCIINSIALLPDTDQFVIAGFFTTYDAVPRNRIALLNSDASLDPNFDPLEGTDGPGLNVVHNLPNQRLLIGGSFSTYRQTLRDDIMRLGGGSLGIGIVNNESSSRMRVYPNPATTSLQLDLGEGVHGPCTIRIHDSAAREVQRTKHILGESVLSVPVHQLPTGVYVLSVELREQRFQVRFIKE